MLYPENRKQELDTGLFRNPTCEYRGTPFWAWNGKLSTEVLRGQIDMLRKMGMGGFHMHVRTGMDSPYLDEEFMAYVRCCVEKAKSDRMLAWLYDEDRWPSGTAGGRVTAGHPEYAKKTLLFTCMPYTPDRPYRAMHSEPGRGIRTQRQDNGDLLACYDIRLNADGTLASFRRIAAEESASGEKWYAYVETATDDPWFNDHPYVDTLNPEAVRKFIDLTHENYFRHFAGDFGGIIPAIFTDEPQFTPKNTLDTAFTKKDVFFPWTGDLPEQYASLYGDALLDDIPELVWELPSGRLSRFRYRFHNLVADRFREAFCDQIGRWCREHHLSLTGHLMGEETLHSQTQAVGDAMRCYPSFGIPGIDMLCDYHQYNTAKQAQSVVRQNGSEGMLSELYGVTGWDYDFRGYKLQGDWQAALGVTVRVPHLTWMTMKGEAKRDYPASIGYQSPWWDQYAMIEDHFARLNTALTRGRARVRVAVVHPIESYWLCWGPAEQTAARRIRMDRQFEQLTETLLFGLIDFDFLSEALLPDQCPAAGNPLQAGQMAYEAVIVCGSRTLRSGTLERLDAFQRAGGRLIFVGNCPDHVDAVKSDAVRPLFDRSIRVDFDPAAILEALETVRELDIRAAGGLRTDRLLYQLRQDGEEQWLFVANGKNPVSPDADPVPELRFMLRGEMRVTEYDSLTGKIRPVPARYENGRTVFDRRWHMHDSLLLRLESKAADQAGEKEPAREPSAEKEQPVLLMHTVPVTLEELNMLLLDLAEYALDDGEFNPAEEVLRLDNAVRDQLGLPRRRKEITQPYLIASEPSKHFVTLRFRVPCEYPVAEPMLALEDPEQTQIRLNGEAVPAADCGWYVDQAIRTIKLPPLPVGKNVLEIRVPIGPRTNLECSYLLGDFGVRVNGVEKTIIPPVRRLGFGDIVPQGLPFYTGNVCYHFDIETGTALRLRVPAYRGGLVKVFIDGQDAGNIAFSPYEIRLKDLVPGLHRVMLRLYGVRQNGFAQLHHTPGIRFYQSPNSWRSAGDLWCYEYQFKPMGILKSPEIVSLPHGRAYEHFTDQS